MGQAGPDRRTAPTGCPTEMPLWGRLFFDRVVATSACIYEIGFRLMSISKDPMGLETTGPAFGREPSWDPEIRQRQQNYLNFFDAGRNLEAEHSARILGGATSSSHASSAQAGGAGVVAVGGLLLLAILLVPLPWLFPPGYAGWIAWHFAAWHRWHALFAGLAGFAVFGAALAVWTVVIVSVPRIFWLMCGFVLGGAGGLTIASSNRLDAVWTGALVLCGAFFVAGWFWGVWMVLAEKFGAERRRPSKTAVATSVGGLMIPFAIVAAGIAYAATLPYRIQDQKFESYLDLAASASGVVLVLATVAFILNLVRGELVAAVFDGSAILMSVLLIIFSAPVHIARWLGYPNETILNARYIASEFAPTVFGCLLTALAFGFVARRFVVRRGLR